MDKCMYWEVDSFSGIQSIILPCSKKAFFWNCEWNGIACEEHKCRCKHQSRQLDNLQKELKWHKFYLQLASEYAKMSKDPRLKVGAIIVTKEGIVYPGYNGDEIGGDNVPDSLEPGQSGFIHAEINACLKFNPLIHKGSSMYVTHNPCPACARAIVNTQSIVAVYYSEDYRDTKGVEILRKRGISCDKI